MSRNQERSMFATEHRVLLLEGDADRTDRRIDAFASDVDRRMDSFVSEIKALRQVLTGILVSLATASVLLAVNLVAGLG